MFQLKNTYSVRPAVKEDIQALFEIYNQYWEVLTGAVMYTLEDFQAIFSRPGFDMESSTQLILSSEGEVIASGVVMDLFSPPVHPGFYGCARQGYEGQGLGSYLLEWGEARSRQAIDRCPKDTRVSMVAQASSSHQPTIKLLEKSGFTPVRYSWMMRKDLADTPPEPLWPDAIRITSFYEGPFLEGPFSEGPDLETILLAVNEAFADHWGYIDPSSDSERLEQFRHAIENDEAFDPSLWFLAMDRDEIAGVALCNSHVGPDRETGYVETLGVRPRWRKQGVGLALLYHAFGEFFHRGYKRVDLSVDTQNLSGATRLYRKAGMQVTRELAVYEKELRPGKELGKQE